MKEMLTRQEVYHFKYTELSGLTTTGSFCLAMGHRNKGEYSPENSNKRKEKRKTGITLVTANGSFVSLQIAAINRKSFIYNTLLA